MSRTAFQGLATVVRFNWHLYVLALIGVSALLIIAAFSPAWLALVCAAFAVLATLSIILSLAATWLAYDASGLYRLHWLDPWMSAQGHAANIHAGFDETTPLLRTRFPAFTWGVFDFYDPVQHTEVSIRRARAAYPPPAETVAISTRHLPVVDASLDRILLILAAHEIRDPQERITFFRELHRALAPDGLLIVTEHLRDLPNIAAYNLGCFHFHRPSTWHDAFAAAQFTLAATLKPAPMITTFILKKHGNPV
ncbi:MAG: methyltransferase domain-containing protein [Burkholderiales bacterium]|nr:methyltransferase domain-containing protein [Opitutaceae bacterium]